MRRMKVPGVPRLRCLQPCARTNNEARGPAETKEPLFLPLCTAHGCKQRSRGTQDLASSSLHSPRLDPKGRAYTAQREPEAQPAMEKRAVPRNPMR